MENEFVYVTKNNCKTVVCYSIKQYKLNKPVIEKAGYRLLTQDEIAEYLKKKGFIVTKKTEASKELENIKGITKIMAKKLIKKGISTIDQVADLNIGQYGVTQDMILDALSIIRNHRENTK